MRSIIVFTILFVNYFPLYGQYKIAFGSCMDSNKPLGILDTILRNSPKDFLFLGDNLYIDSYEKDTFSARYHRLSENSHFQLLKSNAHIYATWDDHDFGFNDANKNYALKQFSNSQFRSFYYSKEKSLFPDSNAIYHVIYKKYKGLKIRYLFLDTRSDLDSLCRFRGKKDTLEGFTYWPQYAPCSDTSKRILSDKQWKWLEAQFQEPYDITFICSSIQFGHSYNGHESWNNFPNERKKMLEFIKKYQVSGVLFLSGDVHYGEISKVIQDDFYPIYDITSSGLTNVYPVLGPDFNRVGNGHTQTNFGFIEIKRTSPRWKKKDFSLSIQLKSEKQVVLEELNLTRKDLMYQK